MFFFLSSIYRSSRIEMYALRVLVPAGDFTFVIYCRSRSGSARSGGGDRVSPHQRPADSVQNKRSYRQRDDSSSPGRRASDKPQRDNRRSPNFRGRNRRGGSGSPARQRERNNGFQRRGRVGTREHSLLRISVYSYAFPHMRWQFFSILLLLSFFLLAG